MMDLWMDEQHLGIGVHMHLPPLHIWCQCNLCKICSFSFSTVTLWIFIVADSSAEHRQANLEVSQLYGLLKSGKHALMLAGLEALKSKEVQSNP
jgi:hypothetical protein